MIGVGLIRLVLALTVVITHTSSIFGFTLGNPVIAVRAFFIISGFYMSLVLNEKYKSVKTFWYNRFLKIFPIYWSVLVVTIVSCILAFVIRGNWGELAEIVKHFGEIGVFNKILLIISHITILGREAIMFSSLAGLPGQLFLLIPQAWTLILELWFYLLAPLILTKKTKIVFPIFVGSILIKYVMLELGFTGTLWIYRFFPSELVYFLMGWFGYRIYKYISKKDYSKYIGLISTFLILLALSLFNYINFNINIREWMFYGLLVILIPLSFISSKYCRLDRFIGDFSYPVYISHILINNIVNPLLILPLSIDKNYQATMVFIFSIMFSFILIRFIQNPIEKIRVEKAKA